MRRHTHTHMLAHIHTHTQTQTHKHTHTHTHTHTRRPHLLTAAVRVVLGNQLRTHAMLVYIRTVCCNVHSGVQRWRGGVWAARGKPSNTAPVRCTAVFCAKCRLLIYLRILTHLALRVLLPVCLHVCVLPVCLYVFDCRYARTHKLTHTCPHLHTQTHTHTHTDAHTHTHTYTHTHTHARTRTQVCVCICMCIQCVYVCMYVCVSVRMCRCYNGTHAHTFVHGVYVFPRTHIRIQHVHARVHTCDAIRRHDWTALHTNTLLSLSPLSSLLSLSLSLMLDTHTRTGACAWRRLRVARPLPGACARSRVCIHMHQYHHHETHTYTPPRPPRSTRSRTTLQCGRMHTHTHSRTHAYAHTRSHNILTCSHPHSRAVKEEEKPASAHACTHGGSSSLAGITWLCVYTCVPDLGCT